MQCPLCGGPLHIDDAGEFVCERGHGMSPEAMRVAATSRVTQALWMAIEALDSEAQGLRALAGVGLDGADGDVALAAQAESDANVLRKLAGSHVPPGADRGAVVHDR
jgi:hypothetical protein